jgi:2-octaprenyl-6-methoxyphenol hydroxylase
MRRYDIVIVGGGMVGASLAARLSARFKDAPLNVLIIESFALNDSSPEANYQPSFDARATALSYGSRQIYEGMGLWRRIAEHVTPIHNIHVSDRGRFGSVWMDSSTEGLPALGYVADNKWLGAVLLEALNANNAIAFACPATVVDVSVDAAGAQVSFCQDDETITVGAELLVIADGAQSAMRSKLGIAAQQTDYRHAAIVCNVETQKPHRNVAYERFTDHGPLAFLPLGENSDSALNSLVWTRSPEDAERLTQAPEAEFNAELQQEFGFRLGRIERCGERFCYPLSLIEAQEQVRPHIIVMGNAAHSLHPVAGQGYNLALRAVLNLVEHLHAARGVGESMGASDVLNSYLAAQRGDQRTTIVFSHLAATVFVNDGFALGLGRDLGLLGLDLLPPLKSRLVRQAAGLAVSTT